MALVIAGVALQLRQPEPGGELVVISETEFIKSDEPAPPPDGGQWLQRTLPDNWRKSNPGLSGYGWYRASFFLPQAPADPWAAYLPTVGTTYQMFLNGVDVGTSGGMTGQITRSLGVPQLDPIAPQLLLLGQNELFVRLRVAPNLRGGLSPITLGPREAVEAIYDADYFARVTMTRSLNISLVFAGVLVLLLWLRRPEQHIYGYFGALSIVWSLRNFHYTVFVPAIPSNLWEAFILGSLGAVVVLLWLFILRFTGASFPRAERAATWACGLSVVAITALDPQLVSAIRVPWYLLCAAFGAWSIVILLRFGLRPANRRRSGVWAILAAACVTLALGLTDLAVTAQLLPFGPSARMAYGAPVLLCALVYALADAYFRTFDQVRSLNTDLEVKFAARAHELQLTHERVRALERATTLSSERDRMMRDMHDGIGSQLMTTLDAVERAGPGQRDVAAMLRECIDDLRLMIDSLEPDEESLWVSLANLRYRLEPRLAAAGIALEWQMHKGTALSAPGEVLQVLRIVQEAVTNTLKHAGASRLRVSGCQDHGWLVLRVQDDGCGMQSNSAARAPNRARRGIENMRTRATLLRGSLDVTSAESGTLLTLRVPMAAAEHAAGAAQHITQNGG